MVQRCPHQFAFMQARAGVAGKAQTLFVEVSDRGRSRAGAGIGLEQMGNALTDLAVGVEHHFIGRVIHQSDREWHFQCPSASLVEKATAQPCTQHVEFGLAHGAFEPEQEPVVEVTRVIDAVLVEDQGVAQRADFQ